jgi:glycosyltransferase involved in cell wall biosynthesis
LIVAVDTVCLSGGGTHTGTGVYLLHVLSEFIKTSEAAGNGHQFHAFAGPEDNWVANGYASASLQVHQTRAMRRLWRFGGMAIHTARIKPDIVFLPTAQHSLPSRFAPVVTTILDAIPKRLPPSMVGGGAGLHLKTWINSKLADKIITISDWSKGDLVEIYGLNPQKIEVVYLGYDEQFFNDGPADPELSEALLARFGIWRPFILHHGMVQLRKNVHRLIEAWDLVRERRKDFCAQLVLAGPLGWKHEEILKVREASKHRDDIVLTGALSKPDLAMLVKNAFCCVIPSLYEGFCLPMVEAMACGVPTVASRASCIPEVSGGVLEYFDPLSIEDMAQAVMRVFEDSDLRNRLRVRGRSRAREFSWERCARETLCVFAETVGRAREPLSWRSKSSRAE